MNAPLVANALTTRLKADTILWSGSAWQVITDVSLTQASSTAAASVQFPYIVIGVQCEQDPTFTSAGGVFQAVFDVYESRANGDANIITICNRLFGDSMLKAGRVPTYGFDRFKLALSSDSTLNPFGFNGSDMQWVSTVQGSETENAVRVSMTFSGRIDAPATSP